MISLSAEQKNLSKLFTQREQYVIPDFQRPYSWTKDQCQKLYDDLVDAYNDERDYFLGNIILAVGQQQVDEPNVVDGQQRLISLWLMLKSLSILLPNTKVLEDSLFRENWDGSEREIKILSKVVETDDWKLLENIKDWDSTVFCDSRDILLDKNGDFAFPKEVCSVKHNCLFFYDKFLRFKQNDGEKELRLFVKFLLERVTMLPIQLIDADIEAANNKALTIFETINDRGLDLSDADIFKAKLCAKALAQDQKDEFIQTWKVLRSSCELLGITLDDVFRYYSHILRGYERNTRNEISLREYFTMVNSPFSQKSYQEVMQDITKITNLLIDYQERKSESTELAAWLQLIDVYTNNYPKYAAITYLFYHGFDDEKALIQILKSIIRYCYQRGSTTYVKYEVYNMIQRISYNESLPSYAYEGDDFPDCLNNMGRLKYAYALLATYLEHKTAIQHYSFDKLLTWRDVDALSSDWRHHPFYSHIDDLGNLVVIDTYKRSALYSSKQHVYANTDIEELRLFLNDNVGMMSYKSLEARTTHKNKVLLAFFSSDK